MYSSMTFRTRTGAKTVKAGDILRATAKHKEAIETVVEQARVLTKESLTKIAGIQDPDLRRSAKR